MKIKTLNTTHKSGAHQVSTKHKICYINFMKTKLLTICLLLFSSQVFALTVTSVERITGGGSHYITFHITLDDLDSSEKVRCIIYNDKGVAIGKSDRIIFGIDKVLVTIPATYNKGIEYSCFKNK